MFGWLKLLKKKFKNLHALIQIIIVLMLVFVIRYLINLIIYSNFTSGNLENFENPKELIYYHMNGCGHCKKFTPEWEKFVQGYNGSLKLKKIERADAGDDLEKYQIQGFPTILLLDGKGNKKEFDGDRTVSGLEQFVSNR